MGSMNFPEHELVLVVRPSLNTICYKVRPSAKLLSFFCYQYKNNKNPQLDERGGFTIIRTQAELVEVLCEEMDVKTLHDTAVPWLMFLGYIDLVENSGTKANHYILYPERVNAALAVHKNREALARTVSTTSSLELFPIYESRSTLELFLNSLIGKSSKLDKKKFQSTLEKVLMYYRNFSNQKRGRKPTPEASAEGKNTTPKIKDNTKINKIVSTTEPTLTTTEFTPSSSLLTAEEETYLSCLKEKDIICTGDEQAVKKQLLSIMTRIQEREQLHRYCDYAREFYQGRDNKTVYLANLAKDWLLNKFLSSLSEQEQDQWWDQSKRRGEQQPAYETVVEALPVDWQTAELSPDLLDWIVGLTQDWHDDANMQANVAILQEIYRQAQRGEVEFYDALTSSARIVAKMPEYERMDRFFEDLCTWLKIPMPYTPAQNVIPIAMEAAV